MILSIPFPQKPDTKTALRYLGVHGNAPSNQSIRELLQTAETQLRAAAQPRGVWVQAPLTALYAGELAGELAGESAAAPGGSLGSDLARHLAGCDSAVLMAATLGAAADGLLRSLSAGNMALAVCADALASAVMEQVCDAVEQQIRNAFAAQQLFVTGRYSPGYGDCPITLQKTLCTLLDAPRAIGLSVTPQSLLTPRKSVTALLGVSAQPVTGWRAGCAHCLLKETCSYRERGITCETESDS